MYHKYLYILAIISILPFYNNLLQSYSIIALTEQSLTHPTFPMNTHCEAATIKFSSASSVTVAEDDGEVSLCVEVAGGVSDSFPVSTMVVTSSVQLSAEGEYAAPE